MNRDDLYLGVDLGTTALKLGVFDAAGECFGLGQAGYQLHTPMTGWAEQDANAWWDGFLASLQQIRSEVDLSRVRAISVAAQSPTVVPVAADGTALRPAITWADRRAALEARWLTERFGRGQVNVDFEALPRIVWVRNHEPEVYQQTRWFMQAVDYLPFRLTGRAVTVRPIDGIEPWTSEQLSSAELDLDRFPDVMLSPGDLIGHVEPGMAAQLGLAPDVMVVGGIVDAFAHWIGVDLSRAGTLCNIGGTSEGASLAWDGPLDDPRHRVFGIPSPFGSGWVVGGAMSNSGGLLDWAVRQLGCNGSRESFLRDMEACPAGAAGLLALPYFMGERTPIYDPNARGVFLGLRHDHTGAHMGRALLESVAFGLRRVTDVLSEVGGEVREIVATGGTANAQLWNHIKADVTGLPVKVAAMKSSGVLGAAILARAAATGDSLSKVSKEMVSYTEVIEPNEKNRAVYDDIYPHFLELYESLRGTFASLAEPRRAR